ncbi:M16 family metallopeptidase [Wenzhouxiangella marina]|uniref:Putative Zn-dependent peptidase n=1 Tax=Wenzhouxiangella marina TaxID=1579979 RepID=A0A0K0XTC6_9GAMM|nr:pitrilysin family protein [Wenzhouxiangella marina]AKS40910.1 Putative Zn-dependent peptidase [Wenzhouxiangella marina]MBB6087784.1 zinc protease [Wenzhouxiangella marina]
MPIADRSLRLLSVFLLVVLSATVTSLSAAPRLVTTVEGISEYELDNGLSVLLMPDSSRPTTTINVTYRVGSKHEGVGETGMAHLLEHLVFFGTPNHQDIKAEISERGGIANGTTWYDRTNYFQTLPAGEENLEWAIRMEADRMVNSLIREEDLESEMTVVRNEFEIGENSPFRVLMQRLMSTAYLWHGYGRSTIGARADIENVPIERLQAFYRKYYQPDNAIVILSGNFEPERALALIETHFGAIPAPERSGAMQIWPSYTRDPVQDGERHVTVRRSGEVQLLMGAWHIPAASHPDFAALSVLSHILGDMPSGRLHAGLVDTELATRVGSFALALGEPSLLMSYIEVEADGDLDAAESAMLTAVAELVDTPPDETEVQRAINALTNGIEQTLNDSNRVGIQLSEWAAAGDWRLMFLHRDRIEAVEVDDVIRVAETYLTRDNRSLARFVPDDDPQRAEIPAAPELGPLLADYTGREDRAIGEAFDPSFENITERLIEFELANGARVALLPKATRGEKVVGSITLRMGQLESLRGLGAAPGLTAAMLSRGTEQRSRQQISDEIDALRSSLNIGGDSMVSLGLTSEREQLPALLELAADLLRNPSFPQEELDELKRQQRASLDQSRDEPFAVANRQLTRYQQPHGSDHPDYLPSVDEALERLEAVQRDDLLAFHASHYGMGESTTISLVGDFDPDAVRAQLEQLFGNWQAPTAFERIPYRIPDAEPVQLEAQLDDKANATLMANLFIPLRNDHPDYPALELAGHLIGGGFLSSRLSNRIRDEEGLSYSVGGGFYSHSIDEYTTFFAYAMFAPENRQALVDSLTDELQTIIEAGFSDEEVEAGKRGYLQQQAVIRANDSSLVNTLGNNRYLERDLGFQEAIEAAIEALDAEQVNAALRRHFDPSVLNLSMAGDFDEE